MKLKAVLWDMDGTLVDTEPYWITAETALMAQYGLQWTAADGRQLIGNALNVSADALRAAGLPLGTAETVERLLDRVGEQVVEHTPFRPGALELLRDLVASGVPTAMVTMSYRRLAEVVARQPPTGALATLITGDEVSAGKPDPAPYLQAAATLGLEPAECIALEDSVTGLTSAAAAGTRAIGVRNLEDLSGVPGATLIDTLQGIDAAQLAGLVGLDL